MVRYTACLFVLVSPQKIKIKINEFAFDTKTGCYDLSQHIGMIIKKAAKIIFPNKKKRCQLSARNMTC